MKKNYITFLLIALTSVFFGQLNAQNESGIDQANIIFDINSGGNQYFDLFGSGNPAFNNHNFGSFDCNNTLILNGAQHSTHKCGDHNISYNELNYRVYPVATAPPAFTSLEILYNQDNNTFLYCTGSSNDQNWQTNGANINILNGLGPGNYNIEVYTIANYESFTDGNGTHFNTNFGANFFATFTVLADTTAPTPDVATLADVTDQCSITTLTPPSATDNCGGTVTVTHNATLPISAQGTTIVTWTYDDGNGNTATQNQNIVINDVSAPIPDVATLADVTDQCSITTLTPPSATDNCGGTVTVTHNATLPISTQGTTVVTWTYDDGNGNTATQNQNIVINDVSAPIPDVATLADVTDQCSITTLTPPSATDNCGGTVTVTHNATLPISAQGTTVVTWTYDDGNGNTATQNQNIVINDVSAPIPDVATLADVTDQCSITTLTPPSATDNCGGTVTVTHNATLPISAQGTTIVTWTYDDGNGNTATQNQNIVINDVSAPIPDVATLADVTDQCSITTLTPPSATDNCGGTVTVTHNATLPISTQGTTVVTWTYDDGNGNTATQNQNIVINDVSAPIPDVATLADVTDQCSITTLTPPSATDNCGGTVTVTHNATLPISAQGTTVVTWTYDDGNGNTATQNQNIVINDVSAPIPDVATLADVTDQCSITTLTPPSATDNCGGTVTVTHNATLPISTQGTTVVTWTYDDGNGNTATQNQNIVITDVSAPTPDVATLADVTDQCSITTLTPPSATDNCGGTVTVTHNATLPISTQGTTVVTWTYDDGNGNTATQNQNIVINDVSAPIPDVATLADVTDQCSITTLTPPSATDNCGGTVTVTHNATLPISTQGTTVVTWTYDDGNGNTATQNQNIVITDVSAPTPDVATLADVTDQCSITTLTPPSATDNCGGTVTVTHNATLPISTQGTTVVTWTYDDGNGNTATQNQNIVINDVSAPIPDVATLADVTDQCSITTLTPPSATDNCGGTVTVTHNATLPISAQGTTVVTWTYDDGNGNTATQNQNIVINDVSAPIPDVATLADVTDQCSITTLTPPSATDNCGGTVTVTHNATLPISAQGTTVVTWTYDDGNGNTATQNQNIVINDVSAPTPDVATLADVTDQCSITTLTPPSATDNCGGTVTVTHNATLPISAQGTTVVTWTYDDGNGNTATQNQNIVINDVSAPIPDVATLADVTDQCSITTLTPPSATDNCGGTVTVTHNATLPISTQGTTVVTWTYDDGNGNTATQNQNIVINDVSAPIPDVATLADVTDQCSITTLTPPSATDNCGGTVTVTHNATLPISTQGTTVVTWTYDDGNGNTATQNQNIVINDVSAPIPDVATLADVTDQCSITTLTPPSATDNCGGTVTVTHNATLPISTQGTTVVTWTYDDGNGNTATQNQNIVINDVSAPIPDVATLADVTDQCSITTLTPPSATDNCGGTVTVTHNATLPISTQGTTVVTWTYDDGNGNTATQNQNIVINDVSAPIPDVATLADVTDQCSITTLTPPSATDNCGGTVTVTHNATLPISTQGTTVVTWTYDDGNGNTATQNQNIVINDVSAPIPDVATLADVTDQCSITTLTPPSATDNCGGTVTVTHNATLPISTQGTTVVTWTYDDGNGNTATQNQNIVINDVSAPIPDVATLADVTDQCSITTLTPPSATDNCGGTVTVTHNATLPISAQGTTVVTWTYDDGNGNTATQNQNIVINDITDPLINCSANVTANTSDDGTGNCSTAITLTNPTVSDNCTPTGSLIVTNDAPAVFSIGITVVTWTVDDGNGNTASCTQNVTVTDDENPTITCPGDQNVTFDANCQFTLQDYTSLASSSDNCDSNPVITQNPAPGSLISGAVTVTLTATDSSSGFSTCTFDVIPSDNISPIAACQNITVYLSPTGTVNVAALDLDNGSSDNCGVANMTVSPNSFNCGEVGDNTVTFTVYDNAGNSDSCTATVTVVDNTPPTMICNDFVVVIDAITRIATIQATDVDNGSNDACGIATLTVSPSTFPEDINGNVYTQSVTLTATDVNGNTNTCTAIVTVEPPKNQFTFLTGQIVNPIPDNPQPPSALIEVTACPDDLTVPRDVEFTLQAIGTYNLQASDVNYWEYSDDNGETWNQIPSTAGLLTYTVLGITSDTFVRLNITDNSDPLNPVVKTSAEAYVRFLPPNEPPVVVSQSAADICLGESVTIIAESFFDQPNGQFGEGGEFNYAQPDGWRVDGVDGDFPASGNSTTLLTWKETNSNNNRTFSGINYDTTDNTKFAMANGVGNVTTLETPVFSTIGMTSAEAIMTFDTSYYFCNGGNGIIELSFDSGNTYSVPLSVPGHTFASGTTTGVIMARVGGNCVGRTDPRMVNVSLDLGAYTGLSGLRIRFTFTGSSTTCQNVAFPNPNGANCNGNNSTVDVASGWAIDAVGFAYAYVDDELEWTDEDGTIIAIGTTAAVTPITPGQREYGVTALVNGCRADNDDGTNFVNVSTSLAYAGVDYEPLASECGESALQLNAYDNTISAVDNFNKGAWENNLYVVPDVIAGDTDYIGTGVTGEWSIVNITNSSCGSTATFSSNTDPDAIFTANPGEYTLRWTITIPNAGPNGTDKYCSDDVRVIITSCSTIDFDGVDDNITFRNNYNFNSAFSIETWVKPNSVNGTRTVLSKKDFANNNEGYSLNIIGGQVVFNWYNSSDSGAVTSGANSVGTDRWYHLAVTFDGSQYILYVDGIELNSANGSAPSQTPGNIEAILGAMDQFPPNQPTNYFHGWIDEVKIWNNAISVEHIRQMMNQRIEASGGDVIGSVIPNKIYGTDLNLDGIEDNTLTWNNLDAYYRMNVTCGDLSPYKGVSGRLRNITTSQQQTAPLPYTSRANQDWTVDNTWTNFGVWDVPNSNGINGSPIDWNIVRTAHNISSGNKDITVLALLVDANELSIEDSGTPKDETNDGQMLWVTHYLKLAGKLDLVGESQLIQKRYSTNQFTESKFDNTSTGYAERDQQGQVNSFNYNYWSSPFVLNNNTNSYSIGSILRDGTTTVTDPINRTINWTANYTAAGGNPTQVSTRWIYAYNDNPSNTYSEWEYLNNSVALNIGLGYTMKGSGNATAQQNYVFIGKPNNGTITNNVSPAVSGLPNDILLGNPYPSSIDANEFIKDNIPLLNPDNSPSVANDDSTESIVGALYFWEHFAANNTHILADYQGGYATYNFVGGLPAATPPITEDGIIIIGGTGSISPERYVPVGQGFFVSGTNGGGTIKFENDQRFFYREGAGSSIFFESNDINTDRTTLNTSGEEDTNDDVIQKVRLKFKSPEGAIRNLLLGFVSNNTADDSFNYGFDAINYDSFPSDMSWLIENENYVIQGVGKFDTLKTYPIGIQLGISGEIEISLESLENFDSDIPVYVFDSLLNTYTQINNSSFILTLDANNYNNRFFITFESEEALNTESENIESIRIYYLQDSQEIYINWVNAYDIDKVSILNILGQNIKQYENIEPLNQREIKLPVKNIADGNYIIRATNKHGEISNKKVIIKH